MSDELRKIDIPKRDLPKKFVEARRRRSGSAYGCVVCDLPIPAPKFMCHVVDGGGVALHVGDEDRYVPDGGDLAFLPLGTDCLRRHPELKPYAHKVEPGTFG